MMFGSPVLTDHPHSNAAFKRHKSTTDRCTCSPFCLPEFIKGVLLFKNYSGLNNLSERQG